MPVLHHIGEAECRDLSLMNEHAELPPIDPGMLNFYQRLCAASPPEAVGWPLARQRKSWDEVCRAFAWQRPEGIECRDVAVPRADGTVRVRIYRPAGARALPGVLYMHGGGWVLGSIETHDDMCAELAQGANATVVAVDYRLAPEHRHPAQLEDNLAVLAWMRRQGPDHGIDPGAIIAAGDSAGGQMSASLCLYLRDKGLAQLQGQVLIYPVLGIDLDTPSYRRNAQGPCLTRGEMVFYWDSVLGPKGGANWGDKYIIPLLETDYRNLPPAFITAAAHDPLHDDAVIYGERLMAAGVAAAVRREPSLAHSYMRARHVSPVCGAGFAAIVEAVRSLAHGGRVHHAPAAQ
jgi:acetyl esterase